MSIYLSIKLETADLFVMGGWKPNKYDDGQDDIVLFEGDDILKWLRRKRKAFCESVLTNNFLRNASRRKLKPIERISEREFYNEEFSWTAGDQFITKIIGYYECPEEGICLVAEYIKAVSSAPYAYEEIDADEVDINYFSDDLSIISICLFTNGIYI